MSEDQVAGPKPSVLSWRMLGWVVGLAIVGLIVAGWNHAHRDGRLVEAWSATSDEIEPELLRQLLEKKVNFVDRPVRHEINSRIILNSIDAMKAGPSVPAAADKSTEGVWIGSEQYEQIFLPYKNPSLPIFITSDSILNAFHVVFEQSIHRLEVALAVELPELVRGLRGSLETVQVIGDRELIARAQRRARIVIGVALALSDPNASRVVDDVQPIIDSEVRLVEEATAARKPSWLGPVDERLVAIDYRKFRPTSFYDRSPSLSRYFRTLRWLQGIPFYLDRDEELLVIALIAKSLGAQEKPRWSRFASIYREFWGTTDDWDLATALLALGDEPLDTARLGEIRARALADNKKRPRINDQVRFPPADGRAASEPNFRVVSAYRLADSVLFGDESTDRPASEFPSGLELCAALGSAFARGRILGAGRKDLLAVIEQSRSVFRDDPSIYGEYLRCLALLLDPPEKDAAPFTLGQRWQIKSCQTVLAGWAQARHTAALHAKLVDVFLNGHQTDRLVGIVEPDPSFFLALAKLARRIAEQIERLDSPDLKKAALIAELSDRIRAERFLQQFKFSDASAPRDRRLFRELYAKQFAGTWDSFVADRFSGGDANLAALVQLREAVSANRQLEQPGAKKMLEQMVPPILPRWKSLAEICDRLAALSQKQLRGEEFSFLDNQFLDGYGETLAALFLYDADAASKPRDDAMRIVDIYRSMSGHFFHVAIGRPRAIYIVYPYKGKDVLCRGAVLPYYEVVDNQRLTDGEWTARLDARPPPTVPAWLEPLYRK